MRKASAHNLPAAPPIAWRFLAKHEAVASLTISVPSKGCQDTWILRNVQYFVAAWLERISIARPALTGAGEFIASLHRTPLAPSSVLVDDDLSKRFELTFAISTVTGNRRHTMCLCKTGDTETYIYSSD
jgi:hypothetical protein